MSKMLWRWLINGFALFLAAELIPGITRSGDWVSLALVALVFGVINALLGPLLKFLSCPLILLTLGVFTIVINAGLLLLTSSLSDAWGLGFHVEGFWPAFLGALLISAISIVLSLVIKDSDKRPWWKKK